MRLVATVRQGTKGKARGRKGKEERKGVDGELKEDVTSLGSVGSDDELGRHGPKYEGSTSPSLSDSDRNKVSEHISKSVPVPSPVSKPFW